MARRPRNVAGPKGYDDPPVMPTSMCIKTHRDIEDLHHTPPFPPTPPQGCPRKYKKPKLNLSKIWKISVISVGSRITDVGSRIYSNKRTTERERGETKRQRNRERHQHWTHHRNEGRQVPASPPYAPAVMPPASRASAPAARGERVGPPAAPWDRGVIREAPAPAPCHPEGGT